MAKVTAPLLSFGADGAIARTQVYSRWRGIPYVRRYVIPANPNTTAQQTTRTTFATLREIWKIAPAPFRDPWDRFARGRPFTGMNAFVGENMRVVRGEMGMDNFLPSPGANAGLPASGITVAQGSSEGELDVTVSAPTPPSGWSVSSVTVFAFPDQDPAAVFGGPLVVSGEESADTPVTLEGLGDAVQCQGGGWIVWEKPDGSLAYSVGLIDQAMSGSSA